MSTEDVVREAIAARLTLFLVYRGGATRVVQPHALYRTTGGRVFLDGYQVAGESSSGMLPGWREFDLAQTTDAEPLGDGFDIAPGFDPRAPKYRRGVLAIVA
jgi:WYL domain